MIAFCPCNFILWKMSIHLITVKVCVVSFAVGVMHPQCLLLNQMWQYPSLSSQCNEISHSMHFLQ